jgi:dTDP-4-dehydrorhamnose reductase
MSRWVVTGAAGMLGSDVVEVLQTAGEFVVGFDHHDLDVTNPDEVRDALATTGAEIVINAAAYTRVDDAEAHESEANQVNGHALGALAIECGLNARLIHLSTDYVFAGDATAPYDEDAATAPKSAYGRSKAMGEALAAQLAPGADVHIVRTAWLYGERGPSFVRTIGRRLLQGEAVDVVNDQRGAPTWTRHLAAGLIALGTADVPSGIWHCSAAGEATWFDVAVAIAEELGCDRALVRPTTTAAFSRPAPRPAYSVLSNRKWVDAGLPVMPHWREQLHEAFAILGGRLTD